jgi:hypothetical protein
VLVGDLMQALVAGLAEELAQQVPSPQQGVSPSLSS